MKRIIIILTLIILTIALNTINAQEKYQYKVDLTNTVIDKIEVNLICPEIAQNEIVYHFPVTVPGIYARSNYGTIIEKFKAFDKSGKEIACKQLDINSYLISNAKNLYRIKYLVNDSWDSKKGKKIYDLEGISIESGKSYLINNGCAFGYFEDMENIPFEIEFIKSNEMYGLTSLKSIFIEPERQKLYAKDYHQLVDCPILFSEPDTISFMVENTKVTIGVYNETGEKVAPLIYKDLKPAMYAINDFINQDLPVDNYTFIVYLLDWEDVGDLIYNKKITIPRLLFKIFLKHGMPQVGALEHGNSSFYYFADFGKPESYIKHIRRVAIHEFMHIYTPLNLHSELIGDFDYSNPKMSKHLWFYEGVPSYYSDQIKLKSGLIDLNQYLNNYIRIKMSESNAFPKEWSLIEFSKNIMDEEYQKHFSQIYRKGTITAMMLDIEIINLTNGEKQLKDVLFTLSNKYGANKSFDEENFINEFVAEVHPDLQLFFDKYIIGKEPLDYVSGFKKIGIKFEDKVEQKVPENVWDNGYGVKKIFESVDYYSINKVEKDSPFKEGDKVKSDDFGYYTMKPFRDGLSDFYNEGEIIQLPILRNGKEITIEIPVKLKQGIYKYKFSLIENPTEKQKKLFNVWTKMN